MKKYLLALFFILPAYMICPGQGLGEHLFRDCLTSTGPTAKYLKDFRIQLGQAGSLNEFRYKTKMSLWKNNTYRFTLCTADNSRGKLILNIWDESNNPILSSVEQQSGTVYPYVDFICSKSGVYQFGFDFTGGQSGSGVSIVSMIE